MFRSFPARGICSRRWVAVVLLVAVFFLPLHFHFFTPTLHIGKLCSCYQGGRTQAGLSLAVTSWNPGFQASLVVAHGTPVLYLISADRYLIRAPPLRSSR